MTLYLVHHGVAVDPSIDPRQPLSDTGRTSVHALAAAAAARGVKPAMIWHSGKLRARQTAEAFLTLCNPLAECSAARGLQPGDPPSMICELLAGESRDLMIVGHLPHLQRVLQTLLKDPAADYPPQGMVALAEEGGGWGRRA